MSGSQLPDLGSAEFLPNVQGLLPRGLAWPRGADAIQTRFFAAVSDCIAAVHANAALLTEVEADVAQATELLPDWEACYGLPDLCSPADQTLAQRRAVVLARMASVGGQSMAYLEGLAALLGYTVTISQPFVPALAGQAHAGDPACTRAVYFWWWVTVEGTSTAPELVCRLGQVADAMVALTITYSDFLTDENLNPLTDESGNQLMVE